MKVCTDFTGGNIIVSKIEENTVFLERDLRDTEGDWFYWAFRVEGAAGKTVNFIFPSKNRIGWHGPAVSHDLKTWHWLYDDSAHAGDRFTYTFGENENTVFFAHHMLYDMMRFDDFCTRHNLTATNFAKTVKGMSVPCVTFGEGPKSVLLTSRHHACESTGTYVLEGVCEELLVHPDFLKEYRVLVVPFVDLDGVIDGDQGKNRRPYDHNRDYTGRPIYDVIKKLMDYGKSNQVTYSFDFHSPWHIHDRNDHVFISHSTESMEEAVSRFASLLTEKTANDVLPFEQSFDCGPNQEWNNENSPNCKNWFSRLPGMRLCVTLETPYFGLDANRVSQDAMLTLGHHFAEAFLAFAKSN